MQSPIPISIPNMHAPIQSFSGKAYVFKIHGRKVFILEWLNHFILLSQYCKATLAFIWHGFCIFANRKRLNQHFGDPPFFLQSSPNPQSTAI